MPGRRHGLPGEIATLVAWFEHGPSSSVQFDVAAHTAGDACTAKN